MRFEIGDDGAGERLDRFLAARFADRKSVV